MGQSDLLTIKVLNWRSWSILLLGILLLGCGEQADSSLTGEQLARVHCSGCHVFPEPSLLPQEKWQQVLPAMGSRLGISSSGHDPFADKPMDIRFQLESANLYPEQALLSEAEWDRLNTYFLDHAPEKLSLPEQQRWEVTAQFMAQFPDLGKSGPPAITMVDYEADAQAFYFADRSGSLGKFNGSGEIAYQIRLPRPIVEVELQASVKLQLLTIGQMYPDESSAGALVQLSEATPTQQELKFAQLPRPVHFVSADLDHDEQEDIVVCSFGNDIGRLSWFEKNGGTYAETVIYPLSGASKVFAEDVDGNGYEDLIVLLAQGDEGVSIFYNEGGKFQEQKILRFPPVFGSNDLEYLDINGDGFKDLILTNGDNGDYSNVLKPYHGVRVYLNDGQQSFTESYFFPMYGAAKVRCRDFDQDGDQDLFVMSFFPDFEQNRQPSLVYLQNQGKLQFEPFQVEGSQQGRWMVMDAGDWDQDGDEDLMIGSFVLNSTGVPPDLLQQWQISSPLMVLENREIP